FNQNVRAVDDLITRDFAATLVDDRQCADPIHRDALALAALNGLQIDVLDLAFDTRFVLRRFFQARRAADVKGPHRKLRARLANRLGRDYADGLADIDRAARGQVAAIALYAAAASRFTSQHRPNAHALHPRALNLGGEILIYFLIGFDDTSAFHRIDDVFERSAAD